MTWYLFAFDYVNIIRVGSSFCLFGRKKFGYHLFLISGIKSVGTKSVATMNFLHKLSTSLSSD